MRERLPSKALFPVTAIAAGRLDTLERIDVAGRCLLTAASFLGSGLASLSAFLRRRDWRRATTSNDWGRCGVARERHSCAPRSLAGSGRGKGLRGTAGRSAEMAEFHTPPHWNRYASRLDESAGMAGIPGVPRSDRRGAPPSDPLGAAQTRESQAELCPMRAAGARHPRRV